MAAAAALAAAAAPAAELLPQASVRLEATRYVPAEDELEWQGWIGGGASLLRAGGVTLWGRAEVETILGQVIRPFEATQANYHLSFGLRATAVVGPACFLLGAADIHVHQMIVAHNFAPGNAGVIFYTDIGIPLMGFIVFGLQRRFVPALSAPTLVTSEITRPEASREGVA